MGLRFLGIGLFLSVLSLPGWARLLTVGTGGSFATLREALARAHPGDTVRLQPGIYRERELEIHVPLLLEGLPGAVLDAEGTGEILRIHASGTTIRGLTLRRSGISFLRDNAAIRVENATDCRIEGNQLQECFFGIYLANAAHCTVVSNTIFGNARREATSGNGIHLWHCRDILIRANSIARHRDGIYFEFVRHATVDSNHSEHNLRYGLHFMFSDSCLYRANLFRRNSAGVAVMYSRTILMEQNHFEHNWGAASFGLLLKDIAHSRIRHNVFLNNTVALYMEGCTATLVDSNRFLSNGWALRLLASSVDNTLTANSFVANTIDVATNSIASANTFRHNYWSRYRGYDLDRNGHGDVPFYPVSAFALVSERYPAVLVLLRSFLVELWDLAERVFPVLTPKALVDPAPLMEPPA